MNFPKIRISSKKSLLPQKEYPDWQRFTSCSSNILTLTQFYFLRQEFTYWDWNILTLTWLKSWNRNNKDILPVWIFFPDRVIFYQYLLPVTDSNKNFLLVARISKKEFFFLRQKYLEWQEFSSCDRHTGIFWLTRI